MLSFSFLSRVSRVSLVCFLKKWPKIDLFWAVFSLKRNQERFLPRNHSQTTSSLYLFINSFTHNNTYYKTTHIKIHHSLRRRKKTQTLRVFAAALSLSRKCCCCLNNAKERARLFLSFFKSDIHHIIFLSSVDNIKRREEYDFRKREIQRR